MENKNKPQGFGKKVDPKSKKPVSKTKNQTKFFDQNYNYVFSVDDKGRPTGKRKYLNTYLKNIWARVKHHFNVKQGVQTKKLRTSLTSEKDSAAGTLATLKRDVKCPETGERCNPVGVKTIVALRVSENGCLKGTQTKKLRSGLTSEKDSAAGTLATLKYDRNVKCLKTGEVPCIASLTYVSPNCFLVQDRFFLGTSVFLLSSVIYFTSKPRVFLRYKEVIREVCLALEESCQNHPFGF